MTRERVYLFDTTLRDGAQTTGVDFSLEDKRAVAVILDRLGVDYVEGGYPGANPLDTAFFAKKQTTRAKFTAFGMTKRAGRSAANDPGVAALLDAQADAICFVAKAWDYHVRVALEISLEETSRASAASATEALARGREVLVDCEHFFDGYKANPEYALACARTAHEAGARWIVLCDTNGGTLPHEVRAIVTEVARVVPGDRLGIHAHDDCACAVANSLAALEAGARQIQGTLNGLGERCGNANLVTLIGTLSLKEGYRDRFALGVGEAALAELTHASRALDEILNRPGNDHAPFVGASALCDQGRHPRFRGAQGPAHLRARRSRPRRQRAPAPRVGPGRQVERARGARPRRHRPQAGRPRAGAPRRGEVPRRPSAYAYEAAEASFYVLVKRMLGEVPNFFDVERFSVNVERRYNAVGDLVTVAEAIVKVKVGDEILISAAEGNGPVNALDLALRKDLGKYQDLIADLELIDYKVRIYQGGSDAVTRCSSSRETAPAGAGRRSACRPTSSTPRSRRCRIPSSTSCCAAARAPEAQATPVSSA
jgi:2-isopropylmalate synthase